ncbi:hypothetical protein Hamer_G018640 [Homarus americanus]|uniref:Uncharacterized protein n=1 Tax=Homarus americanus TaxID=6706 RepID=A0A8J5N4S2_HOMAM|nr:hypothetical protein Hamer_G018640 [Homarus americanus]
MWGRVKGLTSVTSWVRPSSVPCPSQWGHSFGTTPALGTMYVQDIIYALGDHISLWGVLGATPVRGPRPPTDRYLDHYLW